MLLIHVYLDFEERWKQFLALRTLVNACIATQLEVLAVAHATKFRSAFRTLADGMLRDNVRVHLLSIGIFGFANEAAQLCGFWLLTIVQIEVPDLEGR